MSELSLELKRAIHAFDMAAREYAFAGAAPLEDRPVIKRKHQTTKEALEKAILKEIGK